MGPELANSETVRYHKSTLEIFDRHFAILIIYLSKSRDPTEMLITPSFDVGLGQFLVILKVL
ncbi:hypothetical protein PJP12_29540, partial [Mycobacterium kansasii]